MDNYVKVCALTFNRLIGFLNGFATQCNNCLRKSIYNCNECIANRARHLIQEARRDVATQREVIDTSFYARASHVINIMLKVNNKPLTARDLNLKKMCSSPAIKREFLKKMISQGLIRREKKRSKNGRNVFYLYYLKERKAKRWIQINQAIHSC